MCVHHKYYGIPLNVKGGGSGKTQQCQDPRPGREQKEFRSGATRVRRRGSLSQVNAVKMLARAANDKEFPGCITSSANCWLRSGRRGGP
jgi:hypothetical protein